MNKPGDSGPQFRMPGAGSGGMIGAGSGS